MVDKTHPELSIRRQCRILKLPRWTYYYEPIGESPANLALMRRIDELFMELLFFGSRQMRNFLRDEAHRVGRERVLRLMRKMGLMAVYRGPRTSQPHRSIRRIRICCEARQSRGQIRSGAPTSRTFP